MLSQFSSIHLIDHVTWKETSNMKMVKDLLKRKQRTTFKNILK